MKDELADIVTAIMLVAASIVCGLRACDPDAFKTVELSEGTP